MYALNKLYLMMEKQHNRGQEGAGMATVKMDTRPGNEYMFRERAEGKMPLRKSSAMCTNTLNLTLQISFPTCNSPRNICRLQANSIWAT